MARSVTQLAATLCLGFGHALALLAILLSPCMESSASAKSLLANCMGQVCSSGCTPTVSNTCPKTKCSQSTNPTDCGGCTCKDLDPGPSADCNCRK